MDRVDRGLAGLDTRCVRLHDLPANHGTYRGIIQSYADRSDGGVHGNPLAAAGGCHRLRMARRSHRTQDAVDDLDPVVLDLQLRRRSVADLRTALPVSRAA